MCQALFLSTLPIFALLIPMTRDEYYHHYYLHHHYNHHHHFSYEERGPERLNDLTKVTSQEVVKTRFKPGVSGFRVCANKHCSLLPPCDSVNNSYSSWSHCHGAHPVLRLFHTLLLDPHKKKWYGFVHFPGMKTIISQQGNQFLDCGLSLPTAWL